MIKLSAAATERYYEAYQKYGFEKTLINNRGIVNPEDEKLIRRFIDDRIAIKGIGIARQTKIGVVLVYWKRYIKEPYGDLTINDILNGIAVFRNARSEKGESFKQNYQREMIITLKAFVLWLNDENIISINIKKIKTIKPPAIDTETNNADDLFTPEDVNKMITACRNSRDRAFIMTLYETGARPGEIARLAWGDLTFNSESIKAIITDKKTKKKRIAYIIAGKSYLIQYMNDKGNVSPDDFVFKANGDKPLTPALSYKIIYFAAQRAGIKKHVQLKLFRKSRISNMMKEGYNDGAIREQIWGNQGTQMFKVYAKYNDRDIERAMLEKAGIAVDSPNKPEAQTKPRKCHICGNVNQPTAKRCDQCGIALDKSEIDKETEASEQIAIIARALANASPDALAAIVTALQKK